MPPKKKYPKMLIVRLTEEQYEALDMFCKDAGFTKSRFIRELLNVVFSDLEKALEKMGYKLEIVK